MSIKIVCKDGSFPLVPVNDGPIPERQVAVLSVEQSIRLQNLVLECLRVSERLSDARLSASMLGVDAAVLKASHDDVEQFARRLFYFRNRCDTEKVLDHYKKPLHERGDLDL